MRTTDERKLELIYEESAYARRMRIQRENETPFERHQRMRDVHRRHDTEANPLDHNIGANTFRTLEPLPYDDAAAKRAMTKHDPQSDDAELNIDHDVATKYRDEIYDAITAIFGDNTFIDWDNVSDDTANEVIRIPVVSVDGKTTEEIAYHELGI